MSLPKKSQQHVPSSTSIKKQKTDFTDNSKLKNKYEDVFPDFYYSNTEKDLHCKLHCTFAKNISGPASFVNKVGHFSNHKNRTVSCQL